jgi:hypothetical protein
MPSRLPVLMSVAAAVTTAAAAVGRPGVAVVGAATALGLAAAHPAVRDRGVPRRTRLLLIGSLLLTAAAIVGQLWGWRVSGGTEDLIALVRDPGWQREQFLRQAVVAGCLVLACACLVVATSRLPRDRLRHLGPALAVVVPGTLLALVLVPLIIALVGPITAAVEVVCVLGGYAWLVRRTLRRHGAAAIAAVGGTPLILLTWFAVDQAWRSLPDPPPKDGLFQEGFAVAVEVDSGPDLASGGVLAALLLGAVLTVLACARLARAGEPAS